MPVTVHPAPANGTSGVADTAYLSTFYVPNGSYQAGSGFTPNANVAMYCPIRLPSCSIDRLGVFIQVAGTAGAIERLGLYAADDASGVPVTLLADAGTVDCAAAGVKEMVLAAPVSVTAGLYYIAVVSQGAPGTREQPLRIPSGSMSTPFLVPSSTVPVSPRTCLTQPAVSAGLPATPAATGSQDVAPYCFARMA